MKRSESPGLLKGILHNISPECTGHDAYMDRGMNGSQCYGRGIVVGAVGALMSQGLRFNEALRMVKENLPAKFDEKCIPEQWRAVQ